MITKLSVNINKIATLRNSRGHNNPNVVKTALDCELFGADGITVHPRPDERHITYKDVYDLKKVLTTEFNIEGNPLEDKFVQLVLDNKPTQVTLVPDAGNQLTSNHGWDIIGNTNKLASFVRLFKKEQIRVSIFVDPILEQIQAAKEIQADRIELYTEQYAKDYLIDPAKAIEQYKNCALAADTLGIGINAGHDLDLQNLAFLKKQIPTLLEVSIGHALIADAIYLGLENTIQLYKRQLSSL
jgi:pyridoxine 5-phosphate synthase